MFFLEHPDLNGLFNCGTGQARTWLDLVRSVYFALDRTPKIEFIEMPEPLRSKYQYFTEADMIKLRATGCPGPRTSLEEGIRDYVQNYLEAEEEEE